MGGEARVHDDRVRVARRRPRPSTISSASSSESAGRAITVKRSALGAGVRRRACPALSVGAPAPRATRPGARRERRLGRDPALDALDARRAADRALDLLERLQLVEADRQVELLRGEQAVEVRIIEARTFSADMKKRPPAASVEERQRRAAPAAGSCSGSRAAAAASTPPTPASARSKARRRRSAAARRRSPRAPRARRSRCRAAPGTPPPAAATTRPTRATSR